MTARNLHRPASAIAAVLLGLGIALAQPAITIEPIGHWHVFGSKTLTFEVNDEEGRGLEGLDLMVQIAGAHSDRVTVRSVSEGHIADLGGGTYSLHHTVTSLGGHALTVRYSDGDRDVVSSPVAFEVAKAGEEGIVATVAGTTYVYQIRYVWEPGHIHANDSEPATLSFEVMRGIPEGDDIDWERPWSNPFDHVSDAREAVVVVESADGNVVERLTPTYQGRGVYEAERIFSADEVHATSGTYSVRLSFIDPHHGGEVTHAEPYPLHAAEPH